MWHCNDCNKDTSVLKGTIFAYSKMPLPKWFQLITIMLSAKKGISSWQISRDLGVTYKTAWYSAMRVRCAMLDWGEQLEGIVEMDETYVGGKPRKRNQQGMTDDNTAELSNVYNREDNRIKRGRGTKKIAVAGIVKRKGRVVAKVMSRLTSKELLALLKKTVNTKDSVLMTDEFSVYKRFDEVIEHYSINHSQKQYANKDGVHTNTIEGFWSIIKNGIKGQYHVLSKKYLPFYLAEFSYKYNRRTNSSDSNFFEALENATSNEKCLVNYKPKGSVKSIAYPRKRRKSVPKCAA